MLTPSTDAHWFCDWRSSGEHAHTTRYLFKADLRCVSSVRLSFKVVPGVKALSANHWVEKLLISVASHTSPLITRITHVVNSEIPLHVFPQPSSVLDTVFRRKNRRILYWMRICNRLEVPLSHFRLYVTGIRKNFMLVWMLHHLHCVVVV